jgi:hypothetical protein
MSGGANQLTAAIKRAENRASIITSLDDAYGSSSNSSSSSLNHAIITTAATISSEATINHEKVYNRAAAAVKTTNSYVAGFKPSQQQPHGSRNWLRGPPSKRLSAVVDALVGEIADTEGYSAGMKDYNSLVSTIENKSIVLDNAKQQSEASKSSVRKKRTRKGIKAVSKTFLKARVLGHPLIAPALNDLVLLHDAWMNYYSVAVPNETRGAQFQNRSSKKICAQHS